MAVVGDALNWMGFQGNGNIKEDGIEDPETTAHGIYVADNMGHLPSSSQRTHNGRTMYFGVGSSGHGK